MCKHYVLNVIAIAITGCSGGLSSTSPSNDDGGGGSSSCTATTSNTGHILYTADTGLDRVSVYSVDPATGCLTYQSSISTDVGSTPNTGSAPHSLVVTPDHKNLFVTNYGTARIAIFNIDQTTGDLTYRAAYTTSFTHPTTMALNAAGDFLYVNFDNTKTVTYSVNTLTVQLTAENAYDYSTAKPLAYAINPVNQLLSVVPTDSGGMMSYSLDGTTGAMTQIQMQVVLMNDAKFSPDGQWLLAANVSNSRITSWAVDTTAGTLSGFNDVVASSSGAQTTRVLWGLDGSHVYSLTSYDGYIGAYSFNLTTGVMAQIGSVSVGSSCLAQSLAMDPDGDYLFTACNSSAGNVVSYGVSSSGLLSSIDSKASSGAAIQDIVAVKLY